jgi:hypothetical protein
MDLQPRHQPGHDRVDRPGSHNRPRERAPRQERHRHHQVSSTTVRGPEEGRSRRGSLRCVS